MPYGGTKLDAAAISTFPTARGIEKPEPLSYFQPGTECLYLASMGLLDIPFAILADTLTLPITVPVSFIRAAGSQPSSESASGHAAQSVP